MNATILGLDLGTNSIGWALIEERNGRPGALLDSGVRVFQEAVEAKTRTPKNRARREARLTRRQTVRRKLRREALLRVLTESGLLPRDPAEREALLQSADPYVLRARGLDEPLKSYEFGRAIFHLNQRRGFQSNRKTQLGEIAEEYKTFLEGEDAQEIKNATKRKRKGDDDEGVVKAEITALRGKMKEKGARTLGEYLHSQDKKRNRYTDREMYREEFEKLWAAQQGHHPEALTGDLKVRLHEILFFQRPLKTQKFLVGKCRFEPSRKRAMKALLEAQRFRTLQNINDLEVRNPASRDYRPLTSEERQTLLDVLERQASLTWDRARKELGLHDGETFNLEKGGKDKLIGNKTAATLRKALPGHWDKWTPERRSEFVTDVLSFQNKGALLKRLEEDWDLPKAQAYAAATVELERGYLHLSRRAITRILPFMEQGKNYHDACQAAGYLREDQKPRLSLPRLDEPRDLRNPVVRRALYETRRVVNAVIREYGKPDLIRVELAREMKLTKKEKEEGRVEKQNRANRRLNDEAAEILRGRGIQNPTRNDLIKYRLWKECPMCPYTGQSIGMEMLFSSPPEVEIDHILPRDRSLDDSYMNKTLCMAGVNREKGNRTPYEAYSGDPERYAQILQRVSKLPFAKRRKFGQKEIKTDEFIARQLVDTRYISVEVREYLERLGVKVEPVRGGTTAALRRAWGLHKILAVDGSAEKNRADHRHHAIDAVVVALTSVRLLQAISRLSAKYGGAWLGERMFDLPAPWRGFPGQVKESVGKMIVSHAPARKIAGALHEETAYGRIRLDREKGQDGESEEVYVRRVPLASLTKAQVAKIRDAKIRELAGERMEEHGWDAKKAFAEPLYLEHNRKGTGKTPIRTVRVYENFSPSSVHPIREDREEPYKYVKLGNNHHVEILENPKTGARRGEFVSMLEAARRARIAKIPIVQRDHGPEWKFVMSLMVNDMVEIEEDAERKHYRVQNLDASNEVITFRLHTAATLDDKDTRLFKTPNTLRCRKVQVDPLGRITGESRD